VPAIISQEIFDIARDRLAQNRQLARRHNDTYDYLLRGLVNCAQCRLACLGRSLTPGYQYYVCRGRTDKVRVAEGHACNARYAPAAALDQLVWQDLCALLQQPTLVTYELERARTGKWLPQVLQARRETLSNAAAQTERQQTRLLDAYLAEIIGPDEFQRKRQELDRTQHSLTQQLRQLEAQAQQQIETAQLARHIESFCQRLQPALDHLDFAQRRQLVELLVDRVIVDDDKVEIRYAIPTSPKGELHPFVICV
jgi:site-specific DNA recombinase